MFGFEGEVVVGDGFFVYFEFVDRVGDLWIEIKFG